MSRTELNGTERKGTEQNRTEQNRTEQNWTEQNRINAISLSFQPVWLPCTAQYFPLHFVQEHAAPNFYGIIVGCLAGRRWKNSNTWYNELPKFSFNLYSTCIIYKSAGHGFETHVLDISLFGTHWETSYPVLIGIVILTQVRLFSLININRWV